jgi:hypothetical protein
MKEIGLFLGVQGNLLILFKNIMDSYTGGSDQPFSTSPESRTKGSAGKLQN